MVISAFAHYIHSVAKMIGLIIVVPASAMVEVPNR